MALQQLIEMRQRPGSPRFLGFVHRNRDEPVEPRDGVFQHWREIVRKSFTGTDL
jgi:hypothetical protein